MTKRILVMGLPGSGKTTLAQQIVKKLSPDILHLNADRIREEYNDWDFTLEGRIRQAERMRELADKSNCPYVIADFVAPLPEMRAIYAADYTVWMDTISAGRFEDTNKLFVEPTDEWDLRVDEFDSEYWARFFIEFVLTPGW